MARTRFVTSGTRFNRKMIPVTNFSPSKSAYTRNAEKPSTGTAK